MLASVQSAKADQAIKPSSVDAKPSPRVEIVNKDVPFYFYVERTRYVTGRISVPERVIWGAGALLTGYIGYWFGSSQKGNAGTAPGSKESPLTDL
jgi:hypothetical protein